MGYNQSKVSSARAQKHTIFHYLLTAFGGAIKGVVGATSWFFLAASGFLIFDIRVSPFDLLFGLPLILIGAGMGLSQFWEGLVSLISPKFNRLHCRLCQG